MLLLAAAACLPWNRLHAQESNSLSPSPDSRTLVRDIQNPVDYHTGTVNVQAPLYTVQANGISIPITLSYNTSGIKVNDTPTSTGLGWRLSAGGKITRIVKKYPDEQSRRTAVTYIKNDSTRLYHYNSAWLDYLFKTDSTLNEVYELGVFEYLPNGEREGNIPFFDFDTEPDIFYFEIPGNSGIFVLDNDGGAHTIPYQDLAITFIRGTEPTDNRFTIRDNAGNLYKFGSSAESREVTTATTHDNTNHTNTRTLTYNSTWHLDEIAPFSGEQVLFTYEAGTHANEITTRDWFQIGLYALKEGRYELLQFENDYTTATAAAPKFLRQITWSGGKVVFTYDGITSLKLGTTYQVLKNIATYATTRQTNDIHFDYSFFQNGALKLTAVREQYGNDMLYLYKFRYLDMAAFPANNDSFFDHWGYYNNRGDYGYHDYMPAIEIDGIAVPGHDRTPTANARGNILSGIETGNGFSFTYNYELNSIADAANGDRPFGGLRIASITQLIGNGEQTVRRFEYTLPDGRSSGKAFQDKFRYYDPKTGNYISQDPIGLAGGNPTLYGYVFDPNTQIDPLGLDCSYVSKDFKNGASFLITKKDYLRFIAGKKKVGRVDGQFVIPKKDMDNLLKKSNGDIAQIEKALGIPEGNWQDKGGLVRVDIPNPEDYNLRLPTANMSGANEKFELGGKTSGGIPEGVIDQVPKINVIITKL